MLVERASLLNLTVPEMTVLVGGMRALNANTGQSAHGVFTDRPGTLSNDFFVNLLDMSTQWSKSAKTEGLYEGRRSQDGQRQVDGNPGRSGVWFKFRAARGRGILCGQRRPREVRAMTLSRLGRRS
jgi:hypothetical protein